MNLADQIFTDKDAAMRTNAILRGAEGKRLTYRQTDSGLA